MDISDISNKISLIFQELSLINRDGDRFNAQELHTILKIALDVHEERSQNTGIMCGTIRCVFKLGTKCGIKNVILSSGMCPHYNPKLKNEDIAIHNINPLENPQE